MYQNDDTRINPQRDAQNASSNKKTTRFNSQALKYAASAFAGVMAGAGAMWAGEAVASHPADEAGEPHDDNAGNPTIEQPTEAAVAAHQPEAQTEPEPLTEPLSEHEPDSQSESNAKLHSESRTDRVSHPQPEPEPQPEPDPDPAPSPNPIDGLSQDFVTNHDIQVVEIHEVENGDGDTMRIGLGTVDNHESMFLLDDNNGVIAATVDVNDNGQFEENEIIDLRDQHLTLQENGTLQPVSDHQEVRVLAIEDAEINGQTVTVAHLEVNDERVDFVDVNRDGEVNFLLHDDNNNGSIEENEVRDVTDQHIPMPTADDVQPSDDGMMTAQNDELPDYSNDADITMYEA